VTDRVLAEAKTAPDLTSAVAAEYLDLVGYVTYAWLWARMAAAASARLAAAPEPFLADKLALARFYFDRVLPRVQGLVASIGAGAASTACWDDARI
jgi:hypothetical protein